MWNGDRNTPRRHSAAPHMASPHASRRGASGIHPDAPLGDEQWQQWLRPIERKRRLVARGQTPPAGLLRLYIARATASSFRLDGLDVTEDAVAAALLPARGHPGLRPRQIQRIRNHAAILLHQETCLQRGQPLKAATVVRWYTSISCGLSTSQLEEARLAQIEQAIRRINSPQLRLQQAVREIATQYLRVIGEPLVPSFNGILARLLLRYHLGQCQLPPVVFDPDRDPPTPPSEPAFTRRLLQMIDESYTALLSGQDGPSDPGE